MLFVLPSFCATMNHSRPAYHSLKWKWWQESLFVGGNERGLTSFLLSVCGKIAISRPIGCSSHMPPDSDATFDLEAFALWGKNLKIQTWLLSIVLLTFWEVKHVKSVSKVLGKMSDSRISYIASVTIVQRAGNAMLQIKYAKKCGHFWP